MAKLVTILIPCYNEESCIDIIYNRITSVFNNLDYDYEILFINDGSKDNTLKIIKNLYDNDNKHISYVNLARNYGKEIAMACGFDYALGDAVIIIDADLQHPPELIPEMLSYYEEGYDDVYGKRISRGGESFIKKITTKLYYKILQSITKIDVLKDVGDFRCLSRRAVDALKQYKEHRRYTKGFFALIGFKKKAVLYEVNKRISGKTKWNYISLLNLAIEGITSFSNIPLRLISFAGIITAFIGFMYMLFLILKTIIIGETVKGYPSLLSIILFLGGVQLISLGIIGEYLGRIFDEVKNRPLYIVEDYSSYNKENKVV